MAITEDFSIYFDASTGIAVDATYTRQGSAHPSTQSITIQGIFDAEYIDELGIASDLPVFMCEFSKIQFVKNGDKITVINIVYNIRNIQKDGTGFCMLELEKN